MTAVPRGAAGNSVATASSCTRTEKAIPPEQTCEIVDPGGRWQFSREIHRIGFDAVQAMMMRFGQSDDLGLGIRVSKDPHASNNKPVVPQTGSLSARALDREVLADARNALDALFDLMNSSLWAAREHLDATINDWGGGPSSSGELELPDTRPGQSTMGSVWVRLATPGLSGRYAAVTTGLVGVDGSVIPPHCITVKPDSFSLLSGIRQEADVHVDVPMGTSPGKYRGFLTVPDGLVANDGSATGEIVVPLTLLVAA